MEDFAAEVFESFARADQRRWGSVYLRGLLTDGGRKSVEPMAARLGEDGNRQALAHFITSSPWDPAHVRARLAWMMQAAIKPTALVIDDTGFLKDGDASACVTRQYTGTAGKVTNCQAGVSLHLYSAAQRVSDVVRLGRTDLDAVLVEAIDDPQTAAGEDELHRHRSSRQVTFRLPPLKQRDLTQFLADKRLQAFIAVRPLRRELEPLPAGNGHRSVDRVPADREFVELPVANLHLDTVEVQHHRAFGEPVPVLGKPHQCEPRQPPTGQRRQA
ncbi:transposase [Streptomyces sp. BR123]|uniref:IS701 family transposase n=1 Tax=Streptomyces sp. BR123 TaxID=2749828 RepID=UPI00211ADE3F|nr:transposase [Streptomyces sp. BR123]